MSMGLIAPAVDLPREPRPVDEPAAALDESSRTGHPASSPHRRHAAAVLRRLGGRTDAALRHELGRFFAARPDLSPADRAAIARALARFRNQLLHHPRSSLRGAASAPDPARVHPLLDAVRRLFGLADAPHSDPADPRTTGDRPTNASGRSVA